MAGHAGAGGMLEERRRWQAVRIFRTIHRTGWRGSSLGDNIGALLLRNTHHYWFQAGEAHAEPQMLGHGVLSQFVGSFERCSY
ncbi:MAG: hypothetical protein ACWGO1_01115 [Anaerolineales bacterium]